MKEEMFLFSEPELELIVQGLHNIITNCDMQSSSERIYLERAEKIIAYIKSKEPVQNESAR